MNLALFIFLIFIIITFILFKVYRRFILKKYDPSGDNPIHIYLFFLWVLFYIIIAGFSHNYYLEKIQYVIPKKNIYIESLTNNKYTEGSFVLGSGSIGSEDYYIYYTKTSLGYKRDKIINFDVFIEEVDNVKPQIVYYYKEYGDNDRFFKVMNDSKPYFIKILVPKNTIIKEFKIN